MGIYSMRQTMLTWLTEEVSTRWYFRMEALETQYLDANVFCTVHFSDLNSLSRISWVEKLINLKMLQIKVIQGFQHIPQMK